MTGTPGSTVLSMCHIDPSRIDGTAMFARALSAELRPRGFASVFCFPSEPAAGVRDFLKASDVTVHVEPAVFDGRVTHSARRFLQLLRRYQPSIVHLHFMGFMSPLPWLARLHGVEKFFFTDHGSRPEGARPTPPPAWKMMAKAIVRHPVDRVIAPSDYVLRFQLAMRNLPATRLRLIYNGIDVERAARASLAPSSFRARFGIPENRVVVTQISWLIEEKGISDFVAAASMVHAVCPQTHFCMAGAGPRLEDQRRAVAAAGLSSRFTFTGPLTDPFFEGVFGASDIICQPSRWEEAFGWVIGEAMAFGKPVVATRVGGIPEVIHDQVTGFLVPRRDCGELSRRIIELASNPALRERMGAAGYREIAQRFPLSRTVNEHLKLYGIVPEQEINVPEAEPVSRTARASA
jgi:glycosyltransferase involved in cell wall biosynthesis